MRVFQFIGWHNSGKTTLIEQLLGCARWRGRPIAVLKHAHHRAEIDTPGKDSHRLRAAGAAWVGLATQDWEYHVRRPRPTEDAKAKLNRLLGEVKAGLAADHACAPLVLVEGFKETVGQTIGTVALPYAVVNVQGAWEQARDASYLSGAAFAVGQGTLPDWAGALPVLHPDAIDAIAEAIDTHTGL